MAALAELLLLPLPSPFVNLPPSTRDPVLHSAMYKLFFRTAWGHWHQPAVQNMEDRAGYATNDLLIRHPTKPYLRKV